MQTQTIRQLSTMRPAAIWQRKRSDPEVDDLTPEQLADKKRLEICWSHGWRAGYYDDLDKAESPNPYPMEDEREAWFAGYLSGGRSRAVIEAA